MIRVDNVDFNSRERLAGTFDSIAQFGRWVQDASAKRDRLLWGTESVDNASGKTWAEFGYSEALDRALDGGAFPEYEALKQELDLGLPVAEPGMNLSVEPDMLGEELDLTAYREHDPECMHAISFVEADDRVVRIGVNTCNPASATRQQIMNRARAVLAAVNWLEEHGYSVELSIILYNRKNVDADQAMVSCKIVVKPAGMLVSVEQLAFALSAGFYRRLGFRLQECFSEMRVTGYGIGEGGRNQDQIKAELGLDIYLPYMRPDDWGTDASAARRMRAALKGANLKTAWDGTDG